MTHLSGCLKVRNLQRRMRHTNNFQRFCPHLRRRLEVLTCLVWCARKIRSTEIVGRCWPHSR